MKKRCLIALAVSLILLLPAMALAEGETDPATSTPTAQGTAAPQAGLAPEGTGDSQPQQDAPQGVSLSIDDKNVYDGMPKAYQDGYVPKVQKGVVTLVLPLVASGAIKGGALTATPSLGDPSSSPFTFKNYQKSVPLQNNAVNGGAATIASYLVRFDLPLRSGRINGTYPVTIDVKAEAEDGTPVQQSFTSYVTVTDGKDPNATPKPEEPKPQPKVIVSGYGIEPSPVTAGQEFTAKVRLTNTGEDASVRNLTVTASCESPDFNLLNDSATQFVGKLDAGGTAEIELKYSTELKAAPQRYNIALAVEYESEDGAPLTSSGTVPVTVVQALRLKLEAPKLAAQVNAGDTLPLSFQVMNLGRGTVYNVRCELAAPGLIPFGTAFVGNMEGGTARTAEMDVFVGTKEMSEGYEGDDKYGYTSGKITLIYEDESGKEYREETEIDTTINEPPIAPASAEEEEPPQKAGQWWVTISVGCAVAAALAAYLVFRGRRRVKRHEGK